MAVSLTAAQAAELLSNEIWETEEQHIKALYPQSIHPCLNVYCAEIIAVVHDDTKPEDLYHFFSLSQSEKDDAANEISGEWNCVEIMALSKAQILDTPKIVFGKNGSVWKITANTSFLTAEPEAYRHYTDVKKTELNTRKARFTQLLAAYIMPVTICASRNELSQYETEISREYRRYYGYREATISRFEQHMREIPEGAAMLAAIHFDEMQEDWFFTVYIRREGK
jgi:hypothetical protein